MLSLRASSPAVPRRAARRVVGLLFCLVASAVVTTRAHGGDPSSPADGEDPRERDLNAARHAAIEKGCKFLVSNKNLGGSFGKDDKAPVAITALSTLALMSAGSGIDRGPYGLDVRKGIEFLIGLVKNYDDKAVPRVPRGYFRLTSDKNSRMHGQGYATLALACALATANPKSDETSNDATTTEIRSALRWAVRCAEDSQTATGGWGYDPTMSQEHEGSVTVTVAQGLRAAHDAGVRVSGEVVKRGLSYLRISQKEDGSFKYSIQQEHSTYALTAAALSSFYLLGSYDNNPTDGEAIRNAIRYLKKSLDSQMRGREWQFYGHFYAAWAAWQTDGNRTGSSSARWRDSADPEDLDKTGFWGPWHETVYRYLLATQAPDGSWHDDNERYPFGDVLSTAFAVLTLAIPDERLPIFQR